MTTVNDVSKDTPAHDGQSAASLVRESYVPALLANKQNVSEVSKKLGIG